MVVSSAVFTDIQMNTIAHLTIRNLVLKKSGRTIRWWLEKKFRKYEVTSNKIRKNVVKIKMKAKDFSGV